jgi:hypothetical protein
MPANDENSCQRENSSPWENSSAEERRGAGGPKRTWASQLRFWCGLMGVGGYLALSVWYFAALSLEATPPGFRAYLFTWDMFPGFATRSVRRVALGRTASGEYVVLHPSPWSQFREGVAGDLTRADLDRSGAGFQSLVETVRLKTVAQRRDDPLVRVLLCEQSWPVRFNFRDDHYATWMGEPKPVELPFGAPLPELLAPPAGVPSANWRIVREYLVQEAAESHPTPQRAPDRAAENPR